MRIMWFNKRENNVQKKKRENISLSLGALQQEITTD
jgi:hypothetical protein